jgi:hypothetical protein
MQMKINTYRIQDGNLLVHLVVMTIYLAENNYLVTVVMLMIMYDRED